MSDIMNIGASGIRAYQNAISTVSENIANSGVDGYSKRTTNISEVAASTSTITRREVTSASGVTTTGITRASDQFKEADVRSTGADLARSDSAIQWLDQIQTALTGNKLSDQLTSFFNAANAVAADPSASAPRTTMLDAAQGAAAAFTATGSALDQVATNLDATAQNSVTTLNGLAAATGLVVPRLLGTLINRTVDGDAASSLDALALLVVAVVCAQAAFTFAAQRTSTVFGQDLLSSAREYIVRTILRLPLGRVESASSGETSGKLKSSNSESARRRRTLRL